MASSASEIIATLEEGRRQFLALVDDIRPELHRYATRMTGSVADGEDVVQDTLARACFELAQHKAMPPLRPWLFRIAHNLVANWHRDAGRHPTTTVDEVSHWEDRRADPPGDALGSEERHELREAIGRLPADRQQLLVMKFVEERRPS